MWRLSHLGAPGSFSEEAALVWLARSPGGECSTLIGRPDPQAVVELVRAGQADLGLLPVANSRGGLVRSTLEALTAGACLPCEEIALAVRFTLWTRRPGLSLADLEAVASHPQAFRQCDGALAQLVPGRARIECSDTASAARDLAEGVLGPDVAVLASRRAGLRYGLHPLARDMQDDPENRTYFLLFQCRQPEPQQP